MDKLQNTEFTYHFGYLVDKVLDLKHAYFLLNWCNIGFLNAWQNRKWLHSHVKLNLLGLSLLIVLRFEYYYFNKLINSTKNVDGSK